MKKNNFLRYFLSGIGIGIGAAIPGVSGGTIAVIFKVFDKIIWAISNLFKKFKEAFIILLPVVLGAVAAAIPCLILFKVALDGFVFGIVSLFAGFIIGGFPSVRSEVKDVKIMQKHIALLTISLLFALAIGVCSVLFSDKINLRSHFENPEWWFYLVLIPVGMIAATAFIVPGISGSMILLVLGFYKPLLDTISVYVKDLSHHAGQLCGFLGALILGAVIGVLTIAKFLRYLLDKHHDSTFFVIIGFIIGSTISLFFNNDIYQYYLLWAGQESLHEMKPWMPMYVEIPIGIILLIGGAIGSFMLIKYSEKKSSSEVEEESTNDEEKEAE